VSLSTLRLRSDQARCPRVALLRPITVNSECEKRFLPEIKTALDNAFVRHRRRGQPTNNELRVSA